MFRYSLIEVEKTRRTTGGIALLIALAILGSLAAPQSSEAQPRARIGVGTGLAYGSPVAGAGIELELSEHVSALGGVGGLTVGVPFAYGVRVYLHERARKFRLHGSVFRWTEGRGVYIGADHDVGEPSGFVLTYGIGFGEVNLEVPVGTSFGIGYRF